MLKNNSDVSMKSVFHTCFEVVIFKRYSDKDATLEHMSFTENASMYT